MSNIKKLQDIVIQVRRDILRMVHKVNSGHPGGSLGCAEFFVALFYNIMEIKMPFDMNGENQDIFFLSNGHISPVFYSVLARKGFFPIKEISEQVDIEAVRGLKLFMGHGRLDPVVPIGLGHDTKNGLIDIGVNPNYNEYDSEHTISNECLNDILKWLEERN